MTKAAYDVWIEGYLVTGMEGIPQKASFLGTYIEESFADACERACIRNDMMGKSFNKENLSYWGCRFFDNEAEARKSFG